MLACVCRSTCEQSSTASQPSSLPESLWKAVQGQPAQHGACTALPSMQLQRCLAEPDTGQIQSPLCKCRWRAWVSKPHGCTTGLHPRANKQSSLGCLGGVHIRLSLILWQQAMLHQPVPLKQESKMQRRPCCTILRREDAKRRCGRAMLLRPALGPHRLKMQLSSL